MTNAIAHGVVAVLLQCLARLLGLLSLILRMQQTIDRHAAQFFRQVAEQRPACRRGIEKHAVRRMPGDQVGGVLGDQPVQPPCARGLALLADFLGRFAAARQHPPFGDIGDKAPDQDALAILRLHRLHGARLLQAGAHQRQMVHRQQLAHLRQRAFTKQPLQRRVALQQTRLGVEQQRRLRVGRQQRRTARQPRGQFDHLHQQLAQPRQPFQTSRVIDLQQQHARLPRLQLQGQRLTMMQCGTTQTPGQPARQPAQGVEGQTRLLTERRK